MVKREYTFNGNLQYEHTYPTGCGSYIESDYTANPGWHLPTSTEMKQILKAQIEGEYNFGITDDQKFHTAYDGGLTNNRIVWIKNGKIMESNDTGNKHQPAYVRCIQKHNDPYNE